MSNSQVSLTLATPRDTNTETRLHGRKLAIVRGLWFLITVLVVGLVITGIPVRYEKVKGLDPDIRQGEFRDLNQAGVTPEIAASLDVGVGAIIFFALFAGGGLVFWRGSDTKETILLSLTLILMGATFGTLGTVHRTTDIPLAQPLPGLLATIVVFLSSSSLAIVGFWLPDGRFVPRWTAGIVALGIIIFAGNYTFINFPKSHDYVNYLGLPETALVVWAQIYRYRKFADPVLRQQIKWAMVGIIGFCLGFIFWEVTTLLIQHQVGLFPLVIRIIARLVLNFGTVAVPVCFGIAILRYRLWNVDLALNRSLVYGVVTVLVAVVFLGGGLLLQGVLGQVNAGIAFGVSTIGAGLLFNPTRRQAQHIIDRRFYRFRFDLNELAHAQQQPHVKNPGALTGRTFSGYQLQGVLGKGGMGEVYRATANGQAVAIKILPNELAKQQDFLRRFEREAQTLAAFDHPNIVRVLGFGESDGVYFMVLEYVDGQELGDIIHQNNRLSIEDIRPLMADFAAALDYAHAQGFVHRDIKPSNIMVRLKADHETQEAVLMDFGIAKIQDARTALTGTGAIGTIDYMAPEQIMAAREVDHRADIYALGVVLYQMLTGELPFKGGNPGQVLFAHLQQPPPDPRGLVADLPARIAEAVMKAMAKKPEERFHSVEALAAELS